MNVGLQNIYWSILLKNNESIAKSGVAKRAVRGEVRIMYFAFDIGVNERDELPDT